MLRSTLWHLAHLRPSAPLCMLAHCLPVLLAQAAAAQLPASSLSPYCTTLSAQLTAAMYAPIPFSLQRRWRPSWPASSPSLMPA